MDQIFLTPKEVAKVLKINYHKVLDLINIGELPAYRLGHCFKITDSDLLRFLETRRVKSTLKK